MTGTLGILNVGAGDTKLSFDKSNPAECIRAARIVSDMLRRGYALLVEVAQADGTKKYQRVHEFREDTCEYIIADFDPLGAVKPDEQQCGGLDDGPIIRGEEPRADAATEGGAPAPKKRGKRGVRAVPASSANAIAVARSAGG